MNKVKGLNEACSLILGRFESGEIDQAEFDRELAYTLLTDMFQCWSDMAPKPYPVPPARLAAFRNMNVYEKKNFIRDNPGFHDRKEINDFYAKESAIRAQNASQIETLHWMLSVLSEDASAVRKIESRIAEHEKMERLRKGYPEEAEKVSDMFKGEIVSVSQRKGAPLNATQ